jgi:hypothetical protein
MSEKAKGRKFSDTHRENLSKVLTNNPKVTGKAATTEKEMLRRQKIKESWILRKLKKDNKL